MPTYEYACKSCGQHIEVVQSFRDDPLSECAACGGPLRKVFGSIGVTFKGSGFYKTDSRGGSKASSTSKGDKADSKADSKSDSKSDTKADTKSDSGGSSDSSSSPTTTSSAKTA